MTGSGSSNNNNATQPQAQNEEYFDVVEPLSDCEDSIATESPMTPLDGRSDSQLTLSDMEHDTSGFILTSNQQKVVLVTGGAGFVGSHVADALLARGDFVVIVDEVNDYYDVSLKRANLEMLKAKYGSSRLRIAEVRSSSSSSSSSSRRRRRRSKAMANTSMLKSLFCVLCLSVPSSVIHQGDIADMKFMDQLFQQYHPRHVVHMAARAGVRPSIENPFVYIHSNVLGTTTLLELARQYGNDCFVWASSSSVYGESAQEEFSEDDIVDQPVSQYAATKKACELLTYTYHSLYKLNVTGLRFFTVYGPRGRPDMAPFKFVDRVSRGLEIQQFGDGSSSRDYTYIDDVVDGIVRSLDRPMGYQIFNLGNGSPYKLCDFIGLVEKYVGKKAIIRVLPNQPGDVPRTCANISVARELLGYDPSTPFEEGIRKTVEWYQEYYTPSLNKKDTLAATHSN